MPEATENGRNPQNFRPGDHVHVTGEGHREYGKRGHIVELLGLLAGAEQGKARASIKLDADQVKPGKLIFVSLPNLSKIP